MAKSHISIIKVKEMIISKYLQCCFLKVLQSSPRNQLYSAHDCTVANWNTSYTYYLQKGWNNFQDGRSSTWICYVTCKFHLLQQFVSWPRKTSEIFSSCSKMWCVLPRYPMVTMWWGCPEVREHANHPPIVAVSASKGCFPYDVSTVSILGPIIIITKLQEFKKWIWFSWPNQISINFRNLQFWHIPIVSSNLPWECEEKPL